MVLKEALINHFLLFGVTASDEATLGKCLDLCDTYNLDAESLVETWMAFSVSYCDGANPTVEYLCQMERKELKKKSISMPGGSGGCAASQFLKNDVKNLPKIAVYNSLSSMRQLNDNEDILELYGGKTTATTPKSKRMRSPEGEQDFNEVKIRAVESPFSPSSYLPKTVTPSRFASSNRLDRGKILLKYGWETPGWKNEDGIRRVAVRRSKEHQHLPSKSLYMYEKLINKAAALDFVCEEMGTFLCKTMNEIDKVDLEQVATYSRSQSQIQTYGRICCDSDGKLNSASVMLEGTKRLSSGIRVKLDLRTLNQYSIFPGQIVSVKGVNPTGNSLMVQSLLSESPPPPPKQPKAKRVEDKILDVVVAAGPFTDPDNLEYQPLLELIDYLEENKPHVFIMIGPLVEFSHRNIQECDMSDSFDEFFEQCVGNVMRRLKNTHTQVVLVASNRDVHHEPVYPTPEFTLKDKYPNLHLMPDPCMIDIEGLVVGTTSVDSLMHLGREEISSNEVRFDRLTRLATHVLSQKCFYPLVPPSDEVNVDTDLWEKYAFIDRQPHILILPSNLRYFCKNIYNCVVLNPERLAKGSFARIKINYPMENGVWEIADSVAVQILKI